MPTLRRQWWPLLVLGGSQVLLVLDSSTAGITLGPIAQSLDAPVSAVRAVFTLSALLIGATLLTAGKLADVLGRRRALLLGLSVRVVGSALSAGAPTVLLFGLGEAVLESVGAALVITSTSALVAQTYEGPQRLRAYAAIGAACATVLAVAPVVGGLVVDWWTWRAVYGSEAVLAVVLLVSVVRVLDEEQRPEGARPRLDWVGATTSSVGLVLVVLGLQQAERWGWWRPRRSGSGWWGLAPTPWVVAAGVLVLGGFACWELRQHRRGRPTLFDLRLLRVPGLVPTFLVAATAQVGTIGLYFAYPLLLIVVLGVSPAVFGLLLVPAAVTSFAASLLWPRLARRWSPRAVVRLSALCLSAAGAALWVRVSPGVWGVPTSVSAAFVGVAGGLLGAQLPAAVQGLVHDEARSETAGLLGTAQNVGAALGFAVVGTVVLLSMTLGVERLIRDEASVGLRTKELAEVQIDRGIPFVAVDRFRAAAAARGVPADDVEDVAAAYERAQQQGLESGALLVVGLGAIVALLAGWMPSEVASAASGRRTRSPG
jgi:MFS family permease